MVNPRMNTISNKHGDFIWYELLTSDADAASDFYGKVVGWQSHPSEMPDMDYRMFSMPNDEAVGGYMAITPEMATGGARPAWVGYIAVDDVDTSVAEMTAAGGSLYMPAMDVDNVGRMAMVADPQGAPFYVMKGPSDEASHSFAATEPKIGHCAWNELASADPEAAKAFYTAQFGWATGDSMDMGPMGSYDFFKVGDDRGHMIGAVYKLVPEDPQSHWLFYFRVPGIVKAIETIKAEGGRIFQEPTEVPGGEFSIIAYDPQGAAFGLIGPSK